MPRFLFICLVACTSTEPASEDGGKEAYEDVVGTSSVIDDPKSQPGVAEAHPYTGKNEIQYDEGQYNGQENDESENKDNNFVGEIWLEDLEIF